MTVHENGWYKYTFPNVTSLNVIFNNGSGGVGTNQTSDITNITADIWYEWGIGLGSNDLLSKNVRIFPNPTHDSVKIDSEIEFENYECLDAMGRIVQKGKIIQQSIDFKNLEAGLYLLILNGNEGYAKSKLIIH